MSLNCPHCTETLVSLQIGGIELDYCENGCKGIWFDEGELKRIRDIPEPDENFKKIEGSFIPKKRDEALGEKTKMCPRCDVELYRYNWDMKSNIFLDSCEKCNGLWIDGGEMKGMSEYLKTMAAKELPNEEEIQLRLAEIEHRTKTRFTQQSVDNADKLIGWDVWLLDDMFRFLVRKFTD